MSWIHESCTKETSQGILWKYLYICNWERLRFKKINLFEAIVEWRGYIILYLQMTQHGLLNKRRSSWPFFACICSVKCSVDFQISLFCTPLSGFVMAATSIEDIVLSLRIGYWRDIKPYMKSVMKTILEKIICLEVSSRGIIYIGWGHFVWGFKLNLVGCYV